MKVKNFLLVISIVFFVSFANLAFAQTSTAEEATTTAISPTTTSATTSSSTINVSEQTTSTEKEAQKMVNEDENVPPSELGVKEPVIIPGNPFYFLKNWGHRFRLMFVFNRVKKAELMQKYANEKLLELQKVEEKNKDSRVISKAADNYDRALSRLQSYADKIKDATSSPQVNKFMDKFVHQQMLHQRILDRLENQVPTSTFQKIERARQRHLEMFKSVMLKLQNKQQLQDRLEKAAEKGKGSAFRGIQALKTLNKLEKIVPEQSQDSIKKAKQTIIDKLQQNLEKLPPSKQGLLKNYLDKLSGDPEGRINILQDITNNPRLQRIREKSLERMSDKIEESAQKRGCPAFEKPQPGFCKDGRVTIKRDSRGCPVSFECIPLPEIPFKGEYQKQCLFACLKSFVNQTSTTSTIRKCLSAPLVSPNSKKSFKECLSSLVSSENVDKCLSKCENFKRKRYCPSLWNPVCGENGRTYSNSCVAGLAGVKIAHKGICKGVIKREEKGNQSKEDKSIQNGFKGEMERTGRTKGEDKGRGKLNSGRANPSGTHLPFSR